MVERARRQQQSFWDRCWKDRHGQVAIFQMPNGWLYGWVIFTMLALFNRGSIADIFAYIGEASLVVWGLLELFRGDSYFRRLLGLLALVFIVASYLKIGMMSS